MEKVYLFLEKLKEKAEKELEIEVKEFSVSFDLKSDRVLGRFSYSKKGLFLLFNLAVLEKAGFKKYKSVVIHEFCHLLVYLKYGIVRPHGKEWRAFMRFYGVSEPRATTSDFMVEVGVKAKCKCSVHFVSKKIAGQILSGIKFRCKSCGKKIKVKKEKK